MTRFFLGVDTGGTKSHALIADESGRALGFGESGVGHLAVVGYLGLTEVLHTITRQALTGAGISIDQISGSGFGICGYDWLSQREPTLQAIRALGLSGPVELVNDAIVGLLVGASEGWGVAVVAGTGCNCRGWDKQRREGRVAGEGEMGEAAGASELVRKALHAVVREWTRRGPPTCLTQTFIELTGAANPADLIEGIATERYQLTPLAAPLVFQAARAGDPVALDVVLWAGRELGDLACGVIRQLGFESLAFEVVLVGSLHDGSPLLVEAMRETIQVVAPGARLVRLTAPPVVGGVLLGMEQTGLNPFALRETVIRTTNEFLRNSENRTLL